jgi:sugar lactone lactonase YvrE
MLLFSSAGVFAQAPLVLPDPAYGPEGISVDKEGALYVGSLTEGRIVRIDPSTGTVKDLVPSGAGGLVSVVGTHVSADDKVLYACSSDPGISSLKGTTPPALVAFERSTGKLMARHDLPAGGKFCNDITELTDGTILATDSFRPRIYALRPGAQKLDIWFENPYFDGDGFNLNGIAADGGLVYVVRYNKGTLHAIPVQSDGSAGPRKDIALARPLRAPDGLTRLSDGHFLVVEGGGLKAGARGDLTALKIQGDGAVLSPIAKDLKVPTTVAVRGGTAFVVEGQLDHLFDPSAGPASPYRILRVALPEDVR